MCRLTPDVRTEVPVGPGAPALARRVLRESSCAEHHAEVRENSVLLVSEVVTNAVRHGTPPITLDVHCDDSEGLVVSVSDGSRQLPQLRVAELADESGRGVALVDTISDAWGAVPTETGKVVWFRLRPAA